MATTRSILSMLTAGLFLLNACHDEEMPAPSAGDQVPVSASASQGQELRGGVLVTAAPGTSLDAKELEDRNGYGTTLDAGAHGLWFARVEPMNEEGASAMGLPWRGVAYVGKFAGEEGDECVALVPSSSGSDRYLALSRPAEEKACPSEADALDWIPKVEMAKGYEAPKALGDDLAQSSQELAFGSTVGTFNGITAYANGSTGYNSGQYSCCGLKWQCVEYANRYFYQARAHKNLKGTGNANSYYGTASSKGLVAYANGGTVAPAVGDMIPSAGGAYGHIAIIREVGANYIRVIHQNWANDTTDNSKTLTMTVSGGKYTVAGFSGTYPVQGWMRPSGCTPWVSSVSPSTAYLNTTTTFTATGSCLPSTTAPWIADCAGLKVLSASSSQVKFSCVPSYSKGTKSGVVKQGPDGTTLKSFSISVL